MTGERQARRRHRAGNDQPLIRNIGSQPTQKHEEKQIEALRDARHHAIAQRFETFGAARGRKCQPAVETPCHGGCQTQRGKAAQRRVMAQFENQRIAEAVDRKTDKTDGQKRYDSAHKKRHSVSQK